MQRKRHSPVQIRRKIKEIENELAKGVSRAEIAAKLGVSEQTVNRWMTDYGAKESTTIRLKNAESENRRLRRALSELELEKQVLAEAARGNY
ncbi:MAG TPA: transposase [Tepidisphaeraceae bacterium]|jgi:transposase-like protein|nr:transposase [Tepidisphaeraceae bacterium]